MKRRTALGLARWRPRSLRARLLLSLLVAIALGVLLQATLAWRAALAEADALFDRQMQQTAQALRPGLPGWGAGDYPGPLVPGQESHEFVLQIWSADGVRVFESNIGLGLPQRAVLGFANVEAGGTTYRVLSVQTPLQVIQVAQDLAVRRALARQLALRTAWPIVLLAPLLALAAWWAVGGALAPLERVRRQVAQRRADDLAPVDAPGLPAEVRPLLDELNLLLARLQQAFDAQQHFVADAAHELRSPLAALKLQAQALARAPDATARARAAERLGAGIDRATRLVEQLLALARQEAQAAGGAWQTLVLADLVRQALADAAPAAHARGIDLGLLPPDPQALQARVRGQGEALAILLRNLLDNAINYTPAGGRVDVALQLGSDQLVLTVDDSGPGIVPPERARVLRRFHRGTSEQAATGSGLGLAIAEAIARLHGTALQLQDAPTLGGLRVRLALACLPGDGGAAA
ncbi:two-component system, OmpR family, sensor kinase [Oryzisolibacter propanilivorax]|uniref:histidine kinase n=1 Tax=Oryzisolibacter propanilivorax TaxID=1527607 RepID=A0A1G9RLM3_9BURK|nr:ATP-binding protein [Oryzisolibacter propanilivorax]SDM24156.1 two-component system, OmpR family, sensor kinase [Oryzisolibacter propanilivorax]